MNCDRCDIPLKEGISTPSPPEGILIDPGTSYLNWPYPFQKVLKCPNCGRSLSDYDLEIKEMRKRK